MFDKITIKKGVACLQLPVQYLQLLAFLIGHIKTLIWLIITQLTFQSCCP